MTWLSTPELLTAIVTGAAVAGIVGLVVRPTPRLGPRLRPYTVAARTALGGAADVALVPDGQAVLPGARRLLAPFSTRVTAALGRLTSTGGDEALARRLGQAGLLTDLPPAARATAYRLRQLSATALGLGAGTAVGLLTGLGAAGVVGLGSLGAVVGATRWPSRLNSALRCDASGCASSCTPSTRCSRCRCAPAAVSLRPFSGSCSAAPAPSSRSSPRCSCCTAADGPSSRRSSTPRARPPSRTRHARTYCSRAAMLLPIIAILAPVMLLFIAAPLPSLVLGGP